MKVEEDGRMHPRQGRPRNPTKWFRTLTLTLTPDEALALRAWMDERHIRGSLKIGLHDMIAFRANNRSKFDPETGRRVFEITQPERYREVVGEPDS